MEKESVELTLDEVKKCSEIDLDFLALHLYKIGGYETEEECIKDVVYDQNSKKYVLKLCPALEYIFPGYIEMKDIISYIIKHLNSMTYHLFI